MNWEIPKKWDFSLLQYLKKAGTGGNHIAIVHHEGQYVLICPSSKKWFS